MKNRFTRFLIFAFLIFPIVSFSQGEFNNWYFGYKAGVTFNSGSPIAFLTSQMTGPVGSGSSISDSLGNILFYTYGFSVYNRNNNTMPNGWFIGGGSLCASNWWKIAIAFQRPDDETKYYLLDAGCPDPFDLSGLRYSVIDMNLDGGLGDIPPGMNGVSVPGGYRAYVAVTATRDHNNHDIWFVVRLLDTDSNYYASYHVTSAGINFTPVLSNSLVQMYTPPTSSCAIYNMRISRDGTKMAAVYNSIFEYSNFNSATGQVTPLFHYTFQMCGDNHINPTDAEFSVDSRYLYISAAGPDPTCPIYGYLYQFDATKTDSAEFAQSMVQLAVFSVAPGLQLAPDGKIYVTVNGVDSLSVINNPSLQGIACNFQHNVLSLKGRQSGYSFPAYVEQYYAIIYDTGYCQEQPVHFSSAIWPPADSIHWDFGDPSSGSNTSNLPSATHSFNMPGSYLIKLFVHHIDKRVDSTYKVIQIHDSPFPYLGNDQTVCTGDSSLFDAGWWPNSTYVWSNLTLGQMNIGNGQTFWAHQTGTYMVSVTNTWGCAGRDTVNFVTTDPPVVTNNPLSETICTGSATNISLISSVPNTVFYWTATGSSPQVSGYANGNGTMINQVLINAGSINETVTYSITPVAGSCIGPLAIYIVTVTPGDSTHVSITASGNNVCAGTLITFTATPTNGGTSPSYQWKVNGINSGPDNPIFTYPPNNGDVVSCILTSSNTVCVSNNPASSNQLFMVINSNSVVAVTIAASVNPQCAGLPVTFIATPANGGSSPSFQWKVNGVNAGTDSPTYTYNPLNGDLVSCVLTSSIQCPVSNPVTSNTLLITMNNYLPVSITISPSTNFPCEGNLVIFTATPMNGGLTPSYQWKVNGINVGSNSPTYSYIPLNGDLISCELTSSIPCPIANPVTSNILLITMNNNLQAGISITASTNPFCPGNSVTFTATPVNGGTNPAYQWKVNGVNAGTNSSIFVYNPVNNDSVRCIMTSNLICVSGNPTSSNKIIMSGTLASVVTFTACFDTITTTNAQPFKLKGGIPLGGTYSGAGVTSGIFYPAIAGIGTHQITYTYTNAALCSASAILTIVTFGTVVTNCGQAFTDIRDGKTYPTVQIGSQCWMVANLNYGTMIPGNTSQRDNCIWEKYCYNDMTANCGLQTYYQWDEVMQYNETSSAQGFCPLGWHIPTEADWNTLFAHYISNAFAGSPLKYSGFSGFNALLSGARHLNKTWDWSGFATFFWSSTAHGVNKAWAHGMNDMDPSVSLYAAFRSNAFSVRCIKD